MNIGNCMEWFGKIGTAVLGIFSQSKAPAQKQKSGSNSTNIQIGGNITINKGDKKC